MTKKSVLVEKLSNISYATPKYHLVTMGRFSKDFEGFFGALTLFFFFLNIYIFILAGERSEAKVGERSEASQERAAGK